MEASAMALEALKARRRTDYKFQLAYRTRWSDNDQYHHLNNSVYYYLFDSIVNTYLIQHCALHPPTSPQIGLVVHSHCDYLAPIEFPAVVDLALRVNKLGKSSVTYEIGVFAQGDEHVRAVGEFIHVFVDRDSRRPSKEGMNGETKSGLEAIRVDRSML
ncbi:similar to thioesterase family protein [Plenodomus lingam JN3]|uniref:Similar to thioesterase family protein n=2 Tax=Leptosphaeria maculans TaxID=5022 RepID=E4ZZB9_LEPMJ|nr:similar to thioesterase family protein [Plenodomus lingam JN3]CBX96714.1 similar to thioesterase family protein [Plenodomus lingam JN3]